MSAMGDDGNTIWRRNIERQLNKLDVLVRGRMEFGSDRIMDLVEQIDVLRVELAKAKAEIGKLNVALDEARKAFGELRKVVSELRK